MAGVEVPTLREEGPAPEGLAPKLSVDNLPNAEPDLRAQRQGSENVITAAVSLMQKTEHDTAFTYGTAAANHIQMASDSALEKIKSQEGANPHDSFKEHWDTSVNEAFDKVATDPNYDEFTRSIVNKMAQRKLNQVYHQRLMTEGTMQRKYDDGIYDSNGYLLKQSTVESGGDIGDLDKPGAFNNTHEQVRQIEQNFLLKGLKNGGVVPSDKPNMYMIDPADPSGKKLIGVQASPQTLMEIHKYASEGLGTMVQNLANSDKLNEAEAAKEEFKQYLTGKQGALDHKIQSERDLQEASQLAVKMAGEPDEAKREAIAKQASSPKVEIMASRLGSGYVNRIERGKKIQSSQNLEASSKILTEWQGSADPPHSFEEARMRPDLKPLLDQMNDVDKKKFEKAVVRPDVSTKGALSRVQQLKEGTLTMAGPDGTQVPVDVKNMTFAQRSQVMTGLSPSDTATVNQFINKASSNSEVLTNYRQAMTTLQNYGMGKLYFNDNQFGNGMRKDGVNFNQIQDDKAELGNLLDKHSFKSPIEVDNFVRSFVNNKIKAGGGAGGGGFFKTVKDSVGGMLQLSGPSIDSGGEKTLSPANKGKAVKDWQRELGEPREPTPAELKAYTEKNPSRYGL